jgi:hypothetical protein
VPALVDENDGRVVAEGASFEFAVVECCIQYGLGAPLETFTGNKYPERIRAQARRYAEECMRDSTLLQDRLARPVNAIGSTAAEYGRGDIDSALHRGPSDAAKQLMRQLHGLPPLPEEEVPHGTARLLKHAWIRKCAFNILIPEHYRADGSCKCDDAEHRNKMICEWEYSPKDFEGIPLRTP